MKEDFRFRPNGTSLMLTIKELEDAMLWQMNHEVTTIEDRICEVFDVHQQEKHSKNSYLGRMPIKDAVVKFR
jgi:hypothetical protein